MAPQTPRGAARAPAGVSPDSAALADAAATWVGAYVHVPFCAHKCGYCDFASWAGIDALQSRYVDALVGEAERGELAPVDTVFVGGGTPSRLCRGLLTRILAVIPRVAGAEVTVEANPESATPAFLAEALAAGVTRVSLGMQSTAPHVLRFLERAHAPTSVATAVGAARAEGLTDVNLDLIFGTPGETPEDWRRSLDEALAVGPDHISAYALTVATGTSLGRRVRAGLDPPPDDDACADRYETVQAVLGEAGFVQYEVSNWARPGHPCRHNLVYWGGGSYHGLGCSAHGHDAARRHRWWNISQPERYCAAVEAARSPVAGDEDLTEEEARRERIMLGLRRIAGVPEEWVAADLGRAEGLVERIDGRIRMRSDTMFRLNTVLALLL